jgi:hypothetical protein
MKWVLNCVKQVVVDEKTVLRCLVKNHLADRYLSNTVTKDMLVNLLSMKLSHKFVKQVVVDEKTVLRCLVKN